MNHPTEEMLAAFIERGLDRGRIAAHLAECDECLAVVSTLRRAAPKPARRLSFRAAAAAVWILAVAAALAVPMPAKEESVRLDRAPRTYAHIDFADAREFVLAEGSLKEVRIGDHLTVSADAVHSDGWWMVSVKLPEPVVIQNECTMRIELSTNAGFCVASLFPLGKDAVYLRLDTQDSWTTVTAHMDGGAKAGSILKPGDRLDRVTISVPGDENAPIRLLVRAIDLKTTR